MLVVACKLPLGLSVNHGGKILNLNGANADVDGLNPPLNGLTRDTANSVNGYGLTQLNDDEQKAFEDWRLHAMFRAKDGKPAESEGPLDEQFPPLANGSILTFKSMDEARSELPKQGKVNTGFDGIDGDAETKAAAEGSGLVESGTDDTRKTKK